MSVLNFSFAGNFNANFLKLWHFAKLDHTHKKIMKIKQNLIEDDELDPVDAIEHAVEKCKSVDLKIKTPNTVIVFSDTFPDANTKDRFV